MDVRHRGEACGHADAVSHVIDAGGRSRRGESRAGSGSTLRAPRAPPAAAWLESASITRTSSKLWGCLGGWT